MLSLSAQYALRAIITIAQLQHKGPVLARDLADATGIPRQYLSAILRTAVRARLLRSARGRGGGFLLARPPGGITLLEIVDPYEGIVGQRTCPFGLAKCSDEAPCPVHPYWRPVTLAYRRMLSDTSLDAILKEAVREPTKKSRRTRAPLKPPKS